jgi:hypothetical protein
MEDRRLPPFMEYFSEAEDPGRETMNKKYPLIEVIVIAFLAVMSGADGWESIEHGGVCTLRITINTVRPIGRLVNAWAAENQLVFTQVQTEAKSSKITAIPMLLERIAIAGCIITIDAMG